MTTSPTRARGFSGILVIAGLVLGLLALSLGIVDTSIAGSCGTRRPIVIPKIPMPGGCSGSSCGPPAPIHGVVIPKLPSLPCPSKVIPYVPPQFDEEEEEPQKPKPKPKAKVTPTVVPTPQKERHPEASGSQSARNFMLQVSIGWPVGLEDFVWRDPQNARKVYGELVKDTTRLNYLEGEVSAVKDLGHVFLLGGIPAQAIVNYQRALDMNQRAGDRQIHARLLNSIGAALWMQGHFEAAEAYYSDALTAFQAMGDTHGQGQALNNMGVLRASQGKFDDAIKYFVQAIGVDTNNIMIRVLALINLADVCRRQGKYAEAEMMYREALDSNGIMKSSKRHVQILTGFGQLHSEWARVMGAREKYQDAIKELEEAVLVCKQWGLPTYLPSKLLGDVYLDMGDVVRAEQYLREAGFNSGLARLYLVRRDYKKAGEHYKLLMESARKYDRIEDLFVAQTGLGIISESMKQLDESEKHYAEAMDAAERMRDGRLLSERKTFFSQVFNGFSPADPAKGMTRVKLKKQQAGKPPDQTIFASEVTRSRDFSENLAIHADTSTLKVPMTVLDKERDLLDRLALLNKGRDVVTRDQDPLSYDLKTKDLTETEKQFQEFVEMVWRNHKAYAAVRFPKPVDLVEAAVAPEEHIILFDVLGDAVAARLITGRKIVKTHYAEWNATDLSRKIAEFRKAFDDAGQAVRPNMLEAFRPTVANEIYRRLLGDLLQGIPEGSPLTIVPDGILGQLPFEALVVRGRESWTSGGGMPYPEGLVYLGDLYPITYSQSLTALTLVRALPRQGIPGDRHLVVADPIFDVADARWEPAAPEINEHKDIGSGPTAPGRGVTDPVGPAPRYTPTALAPQGAQAEDSTMAPSRNTRTKVKPAVYEPSPAPALPERPPAPPQPPGPAAAGPEMEWPRLPLTADLGRFMAQLYPGRTDVLTEKDAAKNLLLSRPLYRYRSIVFGTHGYFGHEIPGVMEPVLVLNLVPDGTDGYLRMTEVMGLELNADVVALTACRTGVGDYRAGEGIMSMGRAFQYAGSRAVLMSLWNVSEKSSVKMMEAFFQHLRNGDSPAESLRKARMDLRKISPHYSHPYFWGSFVLVGEGGYLSEGAMADAGRKFLEAPPKRTRSLYSVTASMAPKKPKKVDDDEDDDSDGPGQRMTKPGKGQKSTDEYDDDGPVQRETPKKAKKGKKGEDAEEDDFPVTPIRQLKRYGPTL
jgi:tetratricopeptide (TPR) repeat protein